MDIHSLPYRSAVSPAFKRGCKARSFSLSSSLPLDTITSVFCREEQINKIILSLLKQFEKTSDRMNAALVLFFVFVVATGEYL